MHVADPSEFWYRPTAQLTHAAGLFDPVLPLYFPTAQPVQSSEPAADQVPATQMSQTAALLAPVAVLEVPATQSLHASESAPDHWPTGQVWHS